MEFWDEDDRPRFIFSSKPSHNPIRSDPVTPSLRNPILLFSLFLSTSVLALSIFYFQSEPFKSLLIWISLSFLLGPFAPPSLTAGDIRVGIGPPLPEPTKEIEQSDDTSKKSSKRGSKSSRKPDDPDMGSGPFSAKTGYTGPPADPFDGITVNRNGTSVKLEKNEENGVNEEGEWNDGEDEMLKKLMGRHPAGKPGRWEAIAAAYKGRHNVESVIKRAKEMGEKKLSNEDSYNRFLKDRKPVDRRVESGNESNVGAMDTGDGKGEDIGWSSGEDLALLNALKAFPKEVAMRWEKIAAAVPGKSKAACMKRVADLKRDFRSSKAAGGVA